MHHFTSNHEGFEVDNVIRDKGNAQFLYEMKFIENKKSSKQSMTEKSASTAPKGDVWNNETVAQPDNKVKQEFSVEYDAAELDAEYARKMAEDDYAAMEQDEDTGLAEYFQENERQTDEIQRAAQNKKATQSKTAPPSQKFSSNGYAKKKNMVR